MNLHVHDKLTKPTGRILIVDDTPSNVLLLERMLSERGYTTQSVRSGREALDSARTELPDLMLLDINMPVMTGYDVCGHFKNDPGLKDIPIIFISGLYETIDRIVAFNVGGVDYVTKPFHFGEVFARVETHLRLRHLEKQKDQLARVFLDDVQKPVTCLFDGLDLLNARQGTAAGEPEQDRISAARLRAGEQLARIALTLNLVLQDELACSTNQLRT